MEKKEEKFEYRIIAKLDCLWNYIYIAQKHKYILWIWYRKKLSRNWINGIYTEFRTKEAAEDCIEKYKNGEIVERDSNVVWYY